MFVHIKAGIPSNLAEQREINVGSSKNTTQLRFAILNIVKIT